MDNRSKLPASLRSLAKGKLDLSNPLVTEVLAESPRFARRILADRIIVDDHALVLAVLAVGREHRSAGNEESPLAWLVEWLDTFNFEFSSTIAAFDNLADTAEGAIEVEVDDNLRKGPVRHAASLAKDTVDSRLSGIRQLILALIMSEAGWSHVFTPSMTLDYRAALWSHLIDRFVAAHEVGDRLDAWDALRRLDARAVAERPAGDKSSEERQPSDPKVQIVSPRPPEKVRALADQPATIDQLGRRVFARVLAERLEQARAPAVAGQESAALMAHLHGPWGYGKSSVLNLLRQELQQREQPWLVIDFNAWKHQRLRPPWWSLLKTFYAGAIEQSGWKSRTGLSWAWWRWRIRADWLPTLLAAVILFAAAAGLIQMLSEPGAQIVVGLLTVAAGLFAYIRLMIIGSAKAAAIYAESKGDPFDPIIALYRRLVAAAARPVVVFIDDLDRCSSSYVVELIEGVQTLLRSQPVTYVVAADRAWLATAFEQEYGQFSQAVGEPGRPLGHLFLDKLFQISVSLPDLADEYLQSYWRDLLREDEATVELGLSSEQIAAKVRGKHSIEALQQVIEEAPEAEKASLRAAAAVEISRPAGTEHIEHRLQAFATLIEPNPRAMKRLVNAVGMAQARCLLEGRDVPLANIARWSMIELRWPLLAEHLLRHPSDVEIPAGGTVDSSSNTSITDLLQDRRVQAILRGQSMPAFDEAALRALIS